MNIREDFVSTVAMPTRSVAGLEGLLSAVVAASRCMVERSDFRKGLDAAVAQLGALSGHDRAYVFELVDEQRTCVLIAEWDAPGVIRIADMGGYGRFAVADYIEVWSPLLAGRPYQSFTPAKSDANAALNQAVANRSDLMVPIFVGDTCWGCIGFDNCREERHYSEAEVQVLQGAAAAVAAAVLRSQAEAQRLALANARTAEAEALSALTRGVVAATRDLLEYPDFRTGIDTWLAHLGVASMADVVMVFDLTEVNPQAAADIAITSHTWRRDGAPQPQLSVPATEDFDRWTLRLMAGEAVWASIDELVDPLSVQHWRNTDCATNLLMPVVLDGAVACVLCFDWCEQRPYSAAAEAVLRTAADSFAAVVQRQRATDALLAERERRVQAESQRSHDAERHADRLQRHSELLAAVARSAEDLLGALTLWPQLDLVLERIGRVTRAQRAVLVRLDWTPDDAEVLCMQEVLHEWTLPGAVRQMDTALQRFPMLRSDATHLIMTEQLARDGRILTRIEDLNEPFRSEQRSLGVIWSLVYPVMVSGTLWGLLGFDYGTPFEEYDEADLAALKTVASTISEGLERERLEAQALAAERARADENARLTLLLTQVVSSSRVLIDAEPSAFEAAMLTWLGAIGRETQATRATFYDMVPFAETGQPTLRMLCEWVREGVAGSVPCSFAQPFVIDPQGAESVMGELTSGRIVVVQAQGTQGPMRDFLDAQGNATVVAVPVFVGGKQWGAVSFDYAVQRELCEADAAVLQTAADTLSAVLRRNEASAALLSEREARLLAEQRRNSELAGLNEALRSALDALAGQDGEAAFLRDVLVQLQAQTGARAAYLFRNDDADGRLRLVGRSEAGRFTQQASDDDPVIFCRGHDIASALLTKLTQSGRFLWLKIDHIPPVDTDTCEFIDWHLRMGHRANAVHALMIGTRQVGFIGLVFDHDQPLTEPQLELAHALCQPITLALELARLSRLAQRSSEQSAMLKERNRLAREIHDGIAQSFLAIQMQLDLVGGPVSDSPEVRKALSLARHGLTEARQAVAALRPPGLQNNELPAAIQRLLNDADRANPVDCVLVSPPEWETLPTEVEDHLFRIVQEAVNNALRHSQASRLKVELSQATGEASVLVADDGCGFDMSSEMASRGFGLESMQQRAQLIGARIDWLTQPGKGTQVLVSWTAPAATNASAPVAIKASR